MTNSLFYNHIKKTELNQQVIERIEDFAKKNPELQLYIITSPLGEKYEYPYEENAIVLLSPKHKIIFVDLKDDIDLFRIYYDDFIEDLNSISDKFEYKDHIGRPRDWKKEITVKESFQADIDINALLEKHKLESSLQRKCELIISLLIGSINDIEKVGIENPDSLLEKVKKNIVLFDGEQTRFIYKNFPNKTTSIQGLSGTGKTELLLHKLKELYLSPEKNRIFFTCHNIALANTLRDRIPEFFNFMKVEKQIEWNSRLWMNRAWGSQSDKNSGLYSFLCHFYNVPFQRYSALTNYEKIFTQLLEEINKIEEDRFEYAFDYILIDERQDFPNVFFDLCEKIASKKIYIAGDIFQNIFETAEDIELNVDVILNRCYRTDPRTLMFAHAIGMGLFERKKLNWLDDLYWEAIGYKMSRHENREVCLSRDPIRRFQDLELEDIKSMIIQKSTKPSDVIKILKDIQENNSTVKPDDIAIIILDDNKVIYDYIDNLCFRINQDIGWKANRAYETKAKAENEIYITNPNNVKGLEFPFVICITNSIQSTYRYRSVLYTMLTRSFIQSYLLISESKGVNIFESGLEIINREKQIKTIEPTDLEKDAIKGTLIKLSEESNISYKDFLTAIFTELRIKVSDRDKFVKALLQTDIEKFDKAQTVKFISNNKEFYCK